MCGREAEVTEFGSEVRVENDGAGGRPREESEEARGGEVERT